MRRLTSQAGFSIIEVLLAATVFATIAAGVIGAFTYGRQATATTGDRGRAIELADEGVQAMRNIRNAAYSNLSTGTFGLIQSSGSWSLSGSSDTTGIYTRQITIVTNGTNRLLVTATVTWPQVAGTTGSVSDTTELTNWAATTHTPSWNTPVLLGSVNYNGIKVATQGNYAYVVKNAGSNNFTVINTSNTAAPTVATTISITGTPTNIAVSGNYAYVSTNNTAGELVIVNITNPAAPTVAGTYNAAGNASGLGVYVVGNYVYLSRAANGSNDELVIVNVSNPAAPTRVYGFSLNVAMNEVYVNGTTAYVVTNSGTQEVVAFTPVVFGVLYTQTTLNLAGSGSATTIAGNGNELFVGQGTQFYTVNGSSMVVNGTLTLPGTINDLAFNSNNSTYVYAGTNVATGELQVVNISSLTSPTIAGSAKLANASNMTGVSYNSTQDTVVGISNSGSQGTAIFGPN